MRAVIVGGGIGGAAAALALQRKGVEVVVLERATAIAEIGAGVWLTANAVKALEHLDARRRLEPSAVKTSAQVFRVLEDDSPIFTTRLGVAGAARYGAYAFTSHRADLLDALLAGLAGDVLRPGVRVAAIEEHPDGICAVLADGERIEGDLLVGADGLRSTVRSQLFGDDQARFSGWVAWRAVFPASRIRELGLDVAEVSSWIGPRRSVVSYYLRDGELYNFVGFVPASDISHESWTATADVNDLRRAFSGASATVQSIVEAADEAFVTGLYFRDPLATWTVGRAALLGDAAHPMLPTAGQGSAQAMEDAITLAECLDPRDAADPGRPLAEYFRRRHGRATRVLTLSRANLAMMTVDDPGVLRARNGRFRGIERLDPFGEVMWGWMWHHDPAFDDTDAARFSSVASEGPWSQALTAEDRARGWQGEREGYGRFLARRQPAAGQIAAGTLAGVPVARVAAGATGPTVLHLHGGGYVMGSALSAAELAMRIARAVSGEAFVVDYRLAPEHPFPAAFDDAIAAYRGLVQLLGRDVEIVLSGDGAGGGIAVCVGAALGSEEVLPRLVYAISPWCDLALRDPKPGAPADEWIDRDALLMHAAAYLQGADPADPRACPLSADLTRITRLLIHAAEAEALRDDAVRLHERARQSGVDSTLRLFAGATHAFVLFDELPQAAQALRELAETVVARPAL